MLSKSKRSKSQALVREKIRGLVPSRAYGRADTLYGQYLADIRVESDLAVQLALANSSDIRFREFLERMGSPGAKNLQTVAKECGIGLDEFTDWYSKSATQKAIALVQVASPYVNADLIEEARGRWEACERCDGLGWISAAPGLPPDTKGYRVLGDPEPKWIRDCPRCGGLGTQRIPGSEFAREKILEQAGLINKKGSGIAIIQNFGGTGMASAIPRLNALTMDD